MQLEDYFTVRAPDDIRLKGSRIGIEIILWNYLEEGLTAEAIAEDYPSLSLEQIHATLTYYWRNKDQIDSYLHTIEMDLAARYEEQARNPSPAVQRLLHLLQDRQLTASAPEA
jgi:uncharacterized protein (DUF433 family)